MNRRSWLLIAVVLVLMIGATLWMLRYASVRGVMVRQMSLFRQIHLATMMYEKDHGEFPDALTVPEMFDYTTNIRQEDWDFLSVMGLRYTQPKPASGPSFPLLYIADPWGYTIAHPDGDMTYHHASLSPIDLNYIKFVFKGPTKHSRKPPTGAEL